MEVGEELPDPWILFVDGSSCIDGSRAGLIHKNPKGIEFTYALRFRFDATNNEAEYEALIAGLKIAKKIELLAVVEEEGSTWITPIYEYLMEETLPAKKKKARVVKRLLQENYVLREIHEGSCSMHAGPRSMHFASVKHPQTNGLVERANRSLGEGIKARLEERSKDWVEEIPHVLGAYRTMIKTSNEETPFSLTYETKVVIPAEIGMPTLRIAAETDIVQNNEALEINLDLLEEKREQAAIREARSKAKMEKYYNSKVHHTSFKPGDLVYRSNDASHAEDGGKLGPKWEGAYEVTEALGK
ncbi:reverse transcriptase domain-containing protein [Tanacetum coccineum]